MPFIQWQHFVSVTAVIKHDDESPASGKVFEANAAEWQSLAAAGARKFMEPATIRAQVPGALFPVRPTG